MCEHMPAQTTMASLSARIDNTIMITLRSQSSMFSVFLYLFTSMELQMEKAPPLMCLSPQGIRTPDPCGSQFCRDVALIRFLSALTSRQPRSSANRLLPSVTWWNVGLKSSLYIIFVWKKDQNICPLQTDYFILRVRQRQIKITEILFEDLSHRLTGILPPERDAVWTALSLPAPSSQCW